MLGFEEELGNFTLGLTNPSTQSELLKIEQWKEKITLYKDAVTDPGSGIQAVSSTWGKKHILGFSDEEIKLDLQQLTTPLVDELHELLALYPGKKRVKLHVIDLEEKLDIKLPVKEFKVTIAKDLLQVLEQHPKLQPKVLN